MNSLTLTQPDDWHLHVRDGAYLTRTVGDSAQQFHRALIMPNLSPPVTTVAEALAYRQRIIAHLPKASNFTPLMSLYLTDDTTVETIVQAAACEAIHAVKLYPAGATTNSANGVTDISARYPIFAAMEKHGLVLCLHGEVNDNKVDIFDREACFIEQVLTPIVEHFPTLRIVLEHITTADAVEFIRETPSNVAATITAHHLLYQRNDMLAGGIKPHYYCLPIVKRRRHQEELIMAAISGDKHFFLGTDSAPHSISAKQSACGCAGIYTAHAAMAFYAQAFAAAGALDKLEAFASFYGADFYQLPRNTQQMRLFKADWQVPEQLDFGDEQLSPLQAGNTLAWQWELLV